MTFAGHRYQLGNLDAEQMTTIKMLIQAITFQPADHAITEENRWIKIDGTAGPVVMLDRAKILSR
jgi:hypothetical protein